MKVSRSPLHVGGSQSASAGRSAVIPLALLILVAALAFGLYRMAAASSGRVPTGWEQVGERAGEGGWALRAREPKSRAVFRLIPSGQFRMGSPLEEPDRDDDELSHWVTISSPFYLAETETTQAQWQRVMGSNPSRFAGPKNPVEKISWTEAASYCETIDGSLPTEAQWEYACRAGTTSAYDSGQIVTEREASFGGSAKTGGKKSARRMSPMRVKAFEPNAWGLYDMRGNLYEWCSDWFGEYEEANEHSPLRDPVGPIGGDTRVLRGGGWGSEAKYLRSAGRDDFGPGDRNAYIGFRASHTPRQ